MSRPARNRYFADAGDNWEGARCPNCSTTLDDEWWVARERRVRDWVSDLGVVTPCCQTKFSLNDLDYPWQVAFARFQFIVANPTAGVPPGVIKQVARIIGLPVRVIHRYV